MGQKYKLAFLGLIFCCVLLIAANLWADERASNAAEPPSSEALEMISRQMQALAGKLGNLPEPPDMDKKIQLPGDRSAPKKEKLRLRQN